MYTQTHRQQIKRFMGKARDKKEKLQTKRIANENRDIKQNSLEEKNLIPCPFHFIHSLSFDSFACAICRTATVTVTLVRIGLCFIPILYISNTYTDAFTYFSMLCTNCLHSTSRCRHFFV